MALTDEERAAIRSRRSSAVAQVAGLPDHKLVAIMRTPAVTTVKGVETVNRQQMDLKQAATRVWQNRDPVQRARPTGGGLFSFAKPLARPLAKAVYVATATAIGGKLITAAAGFPAASASAPSLLPTLPKAAPGPIPTRAAVKPALARAVTPRAAQILTATVEKPVSLLADIGAFAGNISRAVSAFRGSGPGGFGTPPISSHPGRNPQIVLPPVGTPITQASMLPALGNILRSPVVRGAASGAAASIGIGMLNGGQKKRRRMNPLNVKAARRAIRRVKAVRKITRDIEKSLPTRTVRRATPAGHRSRLSHK